MTFAPTKLFHLSDDTLDVITERNTRQNAVAAYDQSPASRPRYDFSDFIDPPTADLISRLLQQDAEELEASFHSKRAPPQSAPRIPPPASAKPPPSSKSQSQNGAAPTNSTLVDISSLDREFARALALQHRAEEEDRAMALAISEGRTPPPPSFAQMYVSSQPVVGRQAPPPKAMRRATTSQATSAVLQGKLQTQIPVRPPDTQPKTLNAISDKTMPRPITRQTRSHSMPLPVAGPSAGNRSSAKPFTRKRTPSPPPIAGPSQPPRFRCAICKLTLPRPHETFQAPCGHRYCKWCLTRLATTSLPSTRMHCCPRALEDLDSLAPFLEPSVLARLRKRCFEAGIPRAFRAHCADVRCAAFIGPSASPTTLVCPQCGTVTKFQPGGSKDSRPRLTIERPGHARTAGR
ncbi:hypothetical protein PLICRDRAFT_659237 [Plicaturopsis crispa FD-325 SS-3]|nr:hypothetical protein PLICRDRAFT_659237 [Plicaturopsis crispa FD-325 SS-3]